MTATAAPALASDETPTQDFVPGSSSHNGNGAPPAGPDILTTAEPRRGSAPLNAPRVVAVAALLSLCLLALWCVVYVTFISSVQHSRDQHELYSRLRQQLALATAPGGGAIMPGTPIAVLTIPGAALHGEVVVEGTTADVLRAGPGHVRTSPLPGQAGVSVLYGRSVSFGAPFGRVSELKPNDLITVTTVQGTFHYTVTGIRHAGQPWTLPAAGAGALTLVTSEGGWTPSRLVYVDSALQGKPQQDPGGRPTTLSKPERAMAGQHDSLTLVRLVLWLQLLVLAACAAVWLTTRWSRWQVWLVAGPALLAVLWGMSSTAVVLLPNLM